MLITHHEAKPRSQQLKSEIESLDVEGYEVTQESGRTFVATVPNQ